MLFQNTSQGKSRDKRIVPLVIFFKVLGDTLTFLFFETVAIMSEMSTLAEKKTVSLEKFNGKGSFEQLHR